MQTSSPGIEQVAAAFEASIVVFGAMGSPLYAHLSAQAAKDEEFLKLAAKGQAAGVPMHILSAVHYLLLKNPDDPLARYYGTLTDTAVPPDDNAFPEFAQYVYAHQDEIFDILATRTVQTTFAERCVTLLPLMVEVAALAGEPLDLVEIGCSAGLLLAFDKYAYALEGRDGIAGSPGSPELHGEVVGGPALHIPQVASRTGLDLHLVDLSSPEARRWMLALCFPELTREQHNLREALEVVGDTDIRLVEGNALETVVPILSEGDGPLVLFHSACLFYWPPEAREMLDAVLMQASKQRDIYRIALEPTDRFDKWHSGQDTKPGNARLNETAGEAKVGLYRAGSGEMVTVARPNFDFTRLEWCEDGRSRLQEIARRQ